MRTSTLIAAAAALTLPVRIVHAQADDAHVTYIAHDQVTAAFAKGMPMVEVGDYKIHAIAHAVETAEATASGIAFANAGAQATGLQQFALNGDVSFANGGSYGIAATASAEGGPKADGFAVALGVNQGVGGEGSLSFSNDGTFDVSAKLNASGEGGFGFVIASGYRGSGSALSVDVANGGDMDVVANAVVAEGASAAAAGIVLQAAAPFSATGVEAFLEELVHGDRFDRAEVQCLDLGLDHLLIADDDDGEAAGGDVFLRDALHIGGGHRLNLLHVGREVVVGQVIDECVLEPA